MGISDPEAQKQVTIMTKTLKKKQIILAALLLAANISAFAQGNGMAGITEATSMVTSYFDPATKLIYAIGAVVGLIGASRCTASSVQETPIPPRPPQAGSARVSS